MVCYSYSVRDLWMDQWQKHETLTGIRLFKFHLLPAFPLDHNEEPTSHTWLWVFIIFYIMTGLFINGLNTLSVTLLTAHMSSKQQRADLDKSIYWRRKISISVHSEARDQYSCWHTLTLSSHYFPSKWEEENHLTAATHQVTETSTDLMTCCENVILCCLEITAVVKSLGLTFISTELRHTKLWGPASA